MSLYTVEIDNRIYHVNISGESSTVNGETVDADMLALNHSGLHLLRYGQHALELFLSSLDDETYQLLMRGGQRIVSRIAGRTRKRTRADEAGSKMNALSAPMHGLVVDVSVSEGALVEKNQTLVVLESMKMQMQLRAPRDGKVARVTVQPGSQVEKGTVLVQFE